MIAARSLRLATAWSLAVLTLAGSVVALVALNAGGEARVGPLRLMAVAVGYDRRAEPILAAPIVPPPTQQRVAAAASRAAIGEFPYDTSAWLRLAYLDSLQPGGLGPRGLAQLKRSYDLVAIDPDVGLWRIRFALENSQRLTPELRSSVRNEALAMGSEGKSLSELKQMAGTIHNPAGRLSLALWLNRLSSRR